MTRDRWENGAIGALIGGVYGTVLVVMAFPAMAGGHGGYLSLAIFGAPISLVVTGWPTFLTVPLLWIANGFLLGASRRPSPAAIVLLVHLIGVALVLLWGSAWESAEDQWEYLARAKMDFGREITITYLTYGAGQVIAWAFVATRWHRSRQTRLVT